LGANSDLAHFLVFAQDKNWCEAINKELRALEDYGTWEVITLSSGKKGYML